MFIFQLNSLLTQPGRANNHTTTEEPAFNVRLIQEVRSRPYLYDHTNEGYNVAPWRNAAWQEIADTLDSIRKCSFYPKVRLKFSGKCKNPMEDFEGSVQKRRKKGKINWKAVQLVLSEIAEVCAEIVSE